MAEKLGLSDAVELLDETLKEEEEADTKLTEVALGLYEEVETGEEGEEGEEQAEAPAKSKKAGAKKTTGKKR